MLTRTTCVAHPYGSYRILTLVYQRASYLSLSELLYFIQQTLAMPNNNNICLIQNYKSKLHTFINPITIRQMLKQSRQCLHAGEWYTDNPTKLNAELSEYLNKVKTEIQGKKVKALIGPHAGLYYSGPTAAWAYRHLSKDSGIQRVFLFGPAHHKYLPGCGLTYADEYNTPMGPIPVDIDVVDELKQQEGFHMVDIDDQEEEHSLEMHLPYIVKCLGKNIKLVPIMTGPVNEQRATHYGKIFSKYFDDPKTIFIFSSDFCHWGNRFKFTYHEAVNGQIWQSIEKLDGQGMNLIQNHDFGGFEKYINSSKNTICGRHPIFIFLKIVENSQLKEKLKTKFVKYSQSQQVKSNSQSSVSYASSVSYLDE